MPLPSAGSPHRRDMPPPLSPSSSSAFPADAEGDNDAAADEQHWLTLEEWWLAPVEGDDRKVAVAGAFEWKQGLYELSPVTIVKRHWPNVLESEDGTLLLISGSLNTSRMLRNGYSNMVCKHFTVGFPDWWQSCNLRKLKNSDTGCLPCSSNSSSSGVDSTQFYLEKFHLGFEEHTCDGDIATNDNAAPSSQASKGDQRTPAVTSEVRGCHGETQRMALTEKAAVDEEMPMSVCLDVQNSSSLSNGTLILEEYTCDGDIPTKEGTAASNDDSGRYKTPSKEVNNVEMNLITGSPSRERGHDDTAIDVSLAPTVENTDNEISETVDSTPTTDCKKTPVACLTNQGSWGENQHIASNKPVGRPKKQISQHGKCRSAIRSPEIRCRDTYVHWSPLTRGKAKSFSVSTPEALKLKRTRSGRVIVPKLDVGCQSVLYGRDGMIAAVTGVDSPAMPKCSESKTDGRKNGSVTAVKRPRGRRRKVALG